MKIISATLTRISDMTVGYMIGLVIGGGIATFGLNKFMATLPVWMEVCLYLMAGVGAVSILIMVRA